MDSAQTADEAALAAAVAAVEECNAQIAARQAPNGDLALLHQDVVEKQTELDVLKGEVDEAKSVNISAWNALDSHMQMIANAPDCPELGSRLRSSLEVYFHESQYSAWYLHQQDGYGDE